jgi:hypothetical protein
LCLSGFSITIAVRVRKSNSTYLGRGTGSLMLESCKLLLFDDLDSLFLSILSYRRLLNEVYIDFQTFSLGETKSPTFIM